MATKEESAARQPKLTPSQMETILTALYHHELTLRQAGIPGIAQEVQNLRMLLVPLQGKTVRLAPHSSMETLPTRSLGLLKQYVREAWPADSSPPDAWGQLEQLIQYVEQALQAHLFRVPEDLAAARSFDQAPYLEELYQIVTEEQQLDPLLRAAWPERYGQRLEEVKQHWGKGMAAFYDQGSLPTEEGVALEGGMAAAAQATDAFIWQCWFVAGWMAGWDESQ